MTADNMKIWDAVGKTDPKHTKEVSFGRKFTSVNANSQIMEATRQFGPIGVGWGYDKISHEMVGDCIMIEITLWHGSRDNVFGPMPGCAQMFNVGKQKTTDTDAPKKATTDAITKLLSQLGFNADIFLGMWDDNKYVQQRIEETKEKPPEPTGPELRDKLKAWMNAPKTTPEDVRKAWQSNDNFKAKLTSLPQPMQLELKAEAEKICPDLKEAA